MNLLTIKKSTEHERELLTSIYEEAKPYFNKIERRDPLPPLTVSDEMLPGIPATARHCLSIYYLDTLIGYLWVYNDSPTRFYILHFYIREAYRNLGFGRLAIRELEKREDQKKATTAELVVSSNNYLSLRFWQSVGFNKIVMVYKENQINSASIELELQKDSFSKQAEFIHLLPVNEDNAFLGGTLKSTDKQVQANYTLAVPLAIQEAFKRMDTVFPYFICLTNKVIGYAAIVLDEQIPDPENRYWLWQFLIDERYQNRGHASKALELLINQFRYLGVEIITLSTKPENQRAIHLYKKMGFVETGELNEDEVILKKFLSHSSYK
ncbi:hypothetical protein IGI37_003185 [Enterococcus sp. AZ194]|uniref:GNAT family N-acetyltransferase n=1 Tax=Enterococcus sp. AZ194 TaxID=2774629 RepID=UPI003F2254E7